MKLAIRLAGLMSIFVASVAVPSFAQRNETKATDADTPLHLLQPDYPVPYGLVSIENTTNVLNRVYDYLQNVTPAQLVDKQTNKTITDYSKIDAHSTFAKADFRLTSYEWGVTYAAFLQASEATGDHKYKAYTDERLRFLAEIAPHFQPLLTSDPKNRLAMRAFLAPHALDDGGALTAAMIKSLRGGNTASLRPLVDHFLNYILTKEHRLSDGTLARNRPQANSLWLDDLFMAVPAIAQMGKLTGDKKYYDEAVKQVLQFSKRMFNPDKGLYMHGWVEGMTAHPQFHWARANGWAILTKVELLEVLPENHPQRAKILELLRAHVQGLTSYQSGSGFWHQLIDRNDSYLETSATAIYTYCIARAINKGWIDRLAYAPACLLAWNAVTTKVNQKGQVEGTCVGTGMGFEPAFYYHRPISPYAAHGYGPVILAASEIINLLKKNQFEINDSSVQLLLKK
ncbi:glycoside hydrolase family 105 protein [Siphonobacter sp. SORGH_AS_1065]|uniref:glycoside hydrolase family 88/105 protein n=1 Tax=Siphonobacter sp. SORGH_AS_1065 TaxID=3041795 RepID=UPI00278734AE|nr:glycoside hydrolase family 88 protein [Siphonobacter sp. SORGH_AS_1065]MDQ1088181.1 unsaturated rhamnogalacturonyl hydrolase [Siphonobacter sp. SORGH_AS_1065]